LVSTLPWTGIVIGGIADGWRKYRHRQDLPLFLMIWIGVYLVFYQLMATKYPTYTFPILFPLIALTAFYLEDRLEQNNFKAARLIFVPLLIWYGILIFAGFQFLSGAPLYIFAVLNGITLLALMGWWLGLKGQNRMWLILGGVIISYLLFSLMVVPEIGIDRSGKQLARTLAPYAGYQIGTYKFYSTAAVYYSGDLIITKLVSADDIYNYRTLSFNWYAKFTMPVATMQEFLVKPGKLKIIIIKRSDWQHFRSETRGGVTLEKLAQTKKYLIYRIRSVKAKR
jgi:4-amino-4-deoxy-L-arabinose transferase-like glycosyltransferase